MSLTIPNIGHFLHLDHSSLRGSSLERVLHKRASKQSMAMNIVDGIIGWGLAHIRRPCTALVAVPTTLSQIAASAIIAPNTTSIGCITAASIVGTGAILGPLMKNSSNVLRNTFAAAIIATGVSTVTVKGANNLLSSPAPSTSP